MCFICRCLPGVLTRHSGVATPFHIMCQTWSSWRKQHYSGPDRSRRHWTNVRPLYNNDDCDDDYDIDEKDNGDDGRDDEDGDSSDDEGNDDDYGSNDDGDDDGCDNDDEEDDGDDDDSVDDSVDGGMIMVVIRDSYRVFRQGGGNFVYHENILAT